MRITKDNPPEVAVLVLSRLVASRKHLWGLVVKKCIENKPCNELAVFPRKINIKYLLEVTCLNYENLIASNFPILLIVIDKTAT